jgi:hypothetical protein
VEGRRQDEGFGMQAAGLLQELQARGLTRAVVPKLGDRLERFRISNGLTDRLLEQQITGLHPRNVRRAARGARIYDRFAYRIARFLEGAEYVL